MARDTGRGWWHEGTLSVLGRRSWWLLVAGCVMAGGYQIIGSGTGLAVFGSKFGKWLLLCHDGWADGGDAPR